MQIQFNCERCKKTTLHHISQNPVIKGNIQTNELKCSQCVGNPIYVESNTGKLPNFESQKVGIPIKEEELDNE